MHLKCMAVLRLKNVVPNDNHSRAVTEKVTERDKEMAGAFAPAMFTFI